MSESPENQEEQPQRRPQPDSAGGDSSSPSRVSSFKASQPTPQTPPLEAEPPAPESIPLPPVEEAQSAPINAGPAPPKKGFGKTPLLVLALLAVLGFLVFSPDSAPKALENHPNIAAYHDGLQTNQLTRVGNDNSKSIVNSVAVSQADIAFQIERDVLAALRLGDRQKAAEVISGGQDEDTGVKVPELDNQLAEEIESGNLRLYTLQLFDSADEDGDIVEIFVNGTLFSTVPLLHTPTSVVVPLPASGPGQVQLRAAVDGGGGVTVGCQTQEGRFFTSVMMEGEMTILMP